MRGRGQPIKYSCSDLAAAEGPISRPGVASNQEHDALSGSDGAIERIVDRPPGLIEVAAVKIQHPVRFHRS